MAEEEDGAIEFFDENGAPAPAPTKEEPPTEGAYDDEFDDDQPGAPDDYMGAYAPAAADAA